MDKYHKMNIYFFDNVIITICHAPPKIGNSKCSGLQTKDVIELKSCKQISTDLAPLMLDENKTFGGSLFLDFRI